ncbi:XkdW family protein [Paraburkholderia dipogonis]|uniref:XkdW family protein n=1 Tax=Paraburkholderia dipogonis TaxID=1211383 RepID=UPI0038B6D21E
MTNEELFYLLQKFYPGTINGTHYLTGHRLDTEGAQFGEAFITNWKLPNAEPTAEQLWAWWRQHGPEIKNTVAAVHVRIERNERLLIADAMVYKAEDSGDPQVIARARTYRQALRDVPQQAGFPVSVEWPEP